jgi:hypothetical protein
MEFDKMHKMEHNLPNELVPCRRRWIKRDSGSASPTPNIYKCMNFDPKIKRINKLIRYRFFIQIGRIALTIANSVIYQSRT